ncbi:NAD(P)/FAD-dependent oxidoreductase [Virgibacillus byunsanensis]|uniref:NAD(P)/FAD-dependent oxidoreductase n=1 Tax=Virgibacillus byunsanensis TaxID=570945 RepID=A0ABW3LHH6_9BACI
MERYIVIGAGILGASTAYHLAKNGKKVILIDKTDHGEATRAAAGIISPWLSQKRNPKLYNVIEEGANYYPALVKELNQLGVHVTSYSQVGSLYLHKSDNKLDIMVNDATERRETAPEIGEVSMFSGQDVEQFVPIMSERMGAVHISGGAKVNADEFRYALIEGAQKYGVEVIEGEAQLKEGKQVNVHVNGETYTGKKVIVTNGAWAEQLLDEIGVKFKVKSTKTQILYLEMPNQDTTSWPVIMLPNNKYIVGYHNHRVAVGAEHEENNDFDPSVSAGSVYDILKTTFKYAPGLREANFIESRVGFRPSTSHVHPVFGALPQNQNMIIANGLSASGITSGPFLGSEITKHILGQETVLNAMDYQF